MIKEIIELQDSNNISTIGSGWVNSNVSWEFTLFTETAELVDSLGLKWWKNSPIDIKEHSYNEVLQKTEFDLDNIKIELVDLLHFMISYALAKTNGDKVTVAYLFNMYDPKYKQSFSNIAEHKLAILDASLEFSREFMIGEFVQLVQTCGFSLEDIYKLYIKKNALNKFRQDNGYKEGTYSKTWNGKEDNEYLHDIDEHTISGVYNTLQEIYDKEVLNYGT